MGSSFGAPRIRFDWRSFITPAVRNLVLVCTAVFLVQLLIWAFLPLSATASFNHWFGLVPSAAILGLRIWQPVTYIFLHSVLDVWHIVINMLMLWMFGRELERTWGQRRFLNYFFLCGVGAGLITLLVNCVPLFWHRHLSDVPTVGASGAIFGILIANGILFPDRQIWIFPLPVMIPMRPFVAVMVAIEFFSTLGASGDHVSHFCHLGGILVGWLYLRRGSFLFRVRNEMADWRYQRNRRKFEVYMKKNRDPKSNPDHWVN